MSDFTTHTIATAPEASKPFLQKAQDAYGFLPNILGNMSEAPALLEGYTSLAGIFDKTDLSPAERQVILMTNNRLNGCTYCMAAHSVIAQGQDVPDDVIDALRNNTPFEDEKLEALRTFSTVVNETRGYPSDADVKAFLDAGYTKQTILEVVLGTSLKLLSNYTNHIAQTQLDDAFSSQKWSDADKAAA